MIFYDTISNYNQIGLDVLYYLLIGTGITILSRRNAIVSILYLILLYVWLSLYLYKLGLGVIGLLYLLIYVGAIAILFLFILSLMNLKISELTSITNKPDYIIILITIINVIFILYININLDNELFNFNIFDSINLDYTINNLININWSNINQLTEMRIIGELLYTEYAILFIILGLILLLSIISAIFLLYHSSNNNTNI